MHAQAAPAVARARRVSGLRLLTFLAAALAVAFALLLPAAARAAYVPPPITGHIVDQAHTMDGPTIAALDAKLEAFRRQTGFEIVAFVPATLGEETIEDVAFAAFNTWGLGRKGADNGVLLVIAPSERKVRIETGKGVGGALTDLQSNEILRTKVTPNLKAGRIRDAVDQGTTAIADALIAGTPASERPPPTVRNAPSLTTYAIGFGVLLLVIILAVVSPAFRSFLWFFLRIAFLFSGRGGGGGGSGGSGFSGGGGRSGGGGSSDSY